MNPDEILAQIADLSQQFVEAGGDPAQLQDAVMGAAEPGAEPGAEAAPPAGNLADALAGMGGGDVPPEPPPAGGDPFAAASAAAKADGVMSRGNEGAKTDEAQLRKKKSAKA